MRILHTSDWHLGRSFKNVPLLDEQAGFVDQVVEIVGTQAVDLVVVAGDVFDRALPPADAVELWHDALVRIVEAGAQVVAISGNHDQGERLEVPARLLRPGIVIRGIRAPSLVTLDFEDGPLLVAPIPFLEPFLARDLHEGAGAATHQSVLQGWLAAAGEAAAGSPRSLAVSHSFVRGGEGSESERSLLRVGGAEMVDASVFAGFSYVALGHLHRPQVVGADRVAYCGSPLAYSFSETAEKSMRLVEMGPEGDDLRVELLPVDAGRKVVTLRGTLEELLADSSHNRYGSSERFFIRTELTDVTMQRDPMNKLRVRFPGIVELSYVGLARHEPGGHERDGEPELDPLRMTLRYWEESTGSPPTDEEAALLEAAIRVGFADAEVPA
ncbi:MAG: exonuclease sbcCD subunit D [Acidobacteria bacterium]|jgi:exonuclease SbcD|nr:exonuclease sbcCD subunit D [Acidobacteriota bacterium]MDP6422566.1 exonuclease SbcCD subunit D [SAR202 cluster bacterium]MQG58606.1 exonuclease SbcCD subunit D [SAR202 cluster bacterium]|tara:strand:- start:1671 stop:2822 length:1152 start_codon:yes stop_codon:yes gene_type:complete